MLTARGWSLVGAAAGLAVAARLLGLVQLLVLAVAAAVVVVLAATWVRGRRATVEATRALPTRVHVGSDARVDVAVVAGAHGSPTIEVVDRLDRGRSAARFGVAPLAGGAVARGAYRIPTEQRGLHELGPMHATIQDPFGVARRSVRIAGVDEVLVLPRVHALLPPPEVGGDDLDREIRLRRADHRSGGEFLTLREYQTGDDLRRVHWRSTARHDTLMIRQDEARSRAPVRVLLDVRPGAHDRASFERAVEAVASVATILVRTSRPTEVVTTAGAVLGTPGRRFLSSLLDELAVVAPHGADRIAPIVAARTVGLLVAAIGGRDDADVGALGAMVRAGGLLVVVDVRARPAPADAERFGPRRAVVVPAGPGSDLSATWNDTFLRWHPTPASTWLR